MNSDVNLGRVNAPLIGGQDPRIAQNSGRNDSKALALAQLNNCYNKRYLTMLGAGAIPGMHEFIL